MNINLLKEVRKMLELMDKSKAVKHFLWAFLGATFFTLMIYLLPAVIMAFSQYKQITGQ